MKTWPNPTIIQIGNQELYDIGDRIRFTIKEVLPCRGYAGQFGLRDRVVEEAIKRAKPLEIMFAEHPEWHVIMNPIKFKALGKLNKQVGYYANDPMKFYWFFLNGRGEITKQKQTAEQAFLF
jgi:hypothetical protein